MQVGGRSTVSSTIKQIVEIRADEDERFARLLEILGEHGGEDTKVLVFVNSQEKASTLFQQLLNYGYPNQMLHGDMQQVRPGVLKLHPRRTIERCGWAAAARSFHCTLAELLTARVGLPLHEAVTC